MGLLGARIEGVSLGQAAAIVADNFSTGPMWLTDIASNTTDGLRSAWISVSVQSRLMALPTGQSIGKGAVRVADAW